MSASYDERARVKETIRFSCIPLLYGSDRAVRRTARRLLLRYGIRSYALLSGKPSRLPPPPYLTRIPTDCRETRLHASLALHFFAALDPSAVPVLIDCTEDGTLLRSEALRAQLETGCCLTDAKHLGEIPPFSYLTKEKTPRRE